MPAVDRVLGVGSPHGDDVAGWLVVELLSSNEDVRAECVAISAGQLLDYLPGCDRVSAKVQNRVLSISRPS